MDPQYALPYVGLADHHLSHFFSGVPSDECLLRARDYTLRALELDPELAHAHAVMGIVAGLYERNWEQASRHFRTAMSGEAVHWHVRSLYAVFHLQPLGLLGEARRQMERVLEDDPLCQVTYHAPGVALDGLGLEAEAKSAWKRSVELDPGFAIGWMHLALHQSVYGRHAAARESAGKAFSLFPTSPYVIGVMAGALETTGDTARARELLSRPLPDASCTPVTQVCYYLASGNMDETVRWIDEAAGKNFAPTASLLIRPYEKFLSKSPALLALLAKLGLNPACAG